jgi:hypothetical protein
MWNKLYINATECLNTILGKHWVHPFFCDNLNWGAYIVSKELTWIQTPASHEKFFAKPNLLCPAQLSLGGVCLAQLTPRKQSAASSAFRVILRNKWIPEERYRIADTRKPRGNGSVRRMACSIAWKLSFCLSASFLAVSSICAAPCSNMCSTQAGNNSRKLQLPVSSCALALKVKCEAIFVAGREGP